jgi:D-3-phosphoglycerate dehydrogenase
MKCLAVGDMFIHVTDFKKALQENKLFEECEYISWKEDADRTEARQIIRRIETKGSEAYEMEEYFYEKIADVDAIFVHLCPVSEAMIKRAENLKYILTCRGGVENIAVGAARERGITIINCPAHNAYAVAEYTIGLMLCETRNIARADRALRNGEWRESYPNSGRIMEMRSTKVGLIGFGAIGRLVAERLQPFGSTILVHDPFLPDEVVREAGCIPVSKEELLKEADIISLHGRIAAGDPPLIGKEEFKKMKKDAYLINTARAVLVDMEALYEALKQEEIKGAAIDVFPSEPVPMDEPLLALDQVTVANHRGGDTLDSYTKAPETVLKQLEELQKTGTTRYMIRTK